MQAIHDNDPSIDRRAPFTTDKQVIIILQSNMVKLIDKANFSKVEEHKRFSRTELY